MTTQRIVVIQRHGLGGLGPLLIAIAILTGMLLLPFAWPLLVRQESTVMAPIITATAIVAAFMLALRRRGPVSYLEIGVVYTGIAYLYCVYLPLRFVLDGNTYSPWTDGRIVGLGPTPSQLATVTWFYVIYLLCFSVTYLLVRPPVAVSRVTVEKPPDTAMFVVIAALLASIRLIMAAIGTVYNTHAASYIEEYAVIQQLPHLVRQFVAWYLGSEQTLQMMFVLALLCHYRRTKPLLFAILAIWVAVNLSRPGARVTLFFVLLAAAISYERLIRRIRLRTLLVAAVAGLIVSMAIGVLRADRGAGMNLTEVTHTYTEFEGIFANAIDLLYIKHAEGAFIGHPTLYLADVIGVVPQQFVPFTKTSAADWYASTYYPAYYNAGGGLAFGVVPEAIVGHGWSDLIWHGALVGLAFALLQKRMMRSPVPFWFLTVYVWMTVWSYQTMRNTTFGLLMPFLQRVVVPIIVVYLLTNLARVRGRRASLAPA